MSYIDKCIITWQWGNNPTHDEYTTSRAFIFGNYGDNFAHYEELVKAARKDFPKLKKSEITVGKVNNSGYMDGFICISFLVEDNYTHPLYRVKERFDFNY